MSTRFRRAGNLARAERNRGLVALGLLLLGFTPADGADFAFVHPGLLHTRDDLARMRAAVAAQQQPTFAGFEKLRLHPASAADYTPHGPAEEIGRNPSLHHREFDLDASACYQNALMWCLTGERAHADVAKRILNAWSRKLLRVTGADAVLMAGLGPFKLVNAAELLRHTSANWTETDVRVADRMFREVIYPVLKDFAPFANGNWDTAAIKTMLAIAVFCDDRSMFERALRYAVDGVGNGRLTHYIINDAGQCQESGRDMAHAQLGLGHLGDVAEISWNQGLDLYAHAGRRLLAGFEYTARYNLGGEVPFVETLDRTGKYRHTQIASGSRGRLRPIYEQIHNHYAHRAGVAAPWTKAAAEKTRPEGESRPIGDHPGFGTLLFTRKREDPDGADTALPAAPAAVIATGSPERIELGWIAVRGATGYTVRRATLDTNNPAAGSRSHFAVIGEDVRSASYADIAVEPGRIYRYFVTATYAHGESAASSPATVAAGLPPPWSGHDIGHIEVTGAGQFDGAMFKVTAAGTDIGDRADGFRFVSSPLSGDSAIVARFVPQVSAQLAKFGLMMRDTSAPDAAHAALLIGSDRSGDGERPGWSIRLVARPKAAADTSTIAASGPLPAEQVTYGRLTGPLWLRLERRGAQIAAAWSPDGESWRQIGSTSLPLGVGAQAGLAVCSRLRTVATTVMFDHVSLDALR